MQGVTQKTADVLQQISTLNCLKDYILIGGTALSIQINHRLSEDIDFCKWKTTNSEIPKVNRFQIQNELSNLGIEKINILDEFHVDYTVNGVKITFFCNGMYKNPAQLQTTNFINNIKLPDINSIGIMKLEAMKHRSKLRDYFDIYSILKAGGDFNKIVDEFLQYTCHDYRTRDVLSLLADAKRFNSEKNIDHLSPKYKVSPNEISEFLIPYIENYRIFKAEAKEEKKLNKVFSENAMKEELKKIGLKLSDLSHVNQNKLLSGKEIQTTVKNETGNFIEASLCLVRGTDDVVSLKIQSGDDFDAKIKIKNKMT
jgi:hypothetical protein